MKSMDIAVIIPTYNRAHTLKRCLDSVLNQTVKPAEIIVVDDGSSDRTKTLIEECYSTIDYFYQENKGVSAARNMGIAQAGCKWIALLDSDDEWLPTKLERQKNQLFHSGLLVCHSNEIWIRNGVRVNQMNKHKKYGGDIFSNSLKMCAMSPSSILFDRSLWSQYNGFDESYPVCEDYALWLKISCDYLVDYINEPLIKKYGGHDDQLSRRYFAMDKYRIMAIQEILHKTTLTDEKRYEAKAMVLAKLKILEKGAIKHDNHELLLFCQKVFKTLSS